MLMILDIFIPGGFLEGRSMEVAQVVLKDNTSICLKTLVSPRASARIPLEEDSPGGGGGNRQLNTLLMLPRGHRTLPRSTHLHQKPGCKSDNK